MTDSKKLREGSSIFEGPIEHQIERQRQAMLRDGYEKGHVFLAYYMLKNEYEAVTAVRTRVVEV